MSKRRDLSLLEKVNLLEKYDALFPISQHKAATELGVSQPMLSKLLKSREEIQAIKIGNENTSRKRKRFGKDEQVEKALVDWFEQVRDQNLTLTGPILRAKAENLAKQLGKEDFVATEGWFRRFVSRQNLMYRKPYSKRVKTDVSTPIATATARAPVKAPITEASIRDAWPGLIDQYTPDDIFNAAETGIYYKALPESTTNVFENETWKGFRIATDRITVLCCCSMSGKKEEMLVIGKNKNPGCFKNVKTIPITYFANENAWMTSRIFKQWLIKWDLRLNRNILLLIDNCTAHNIDTSLLQHIRVVFLPANSSSLIQPLDQGIFRNLKLYYRNEMRQRVLEQIEYDDQVDLADEVDKQIDLLSALHLLKHSWHLVTETTISDCFKNAGFYSKTEQVEVLCDLPFLNDLSKDTFEQWMNIDSNLTTAAPSTEADKCNTIILQVQDNEELLMSEEEVEDEIIVPSRKQVIDALAIIRRFVQCTGTVEDFDENSKFEKRVRDLLDAN